MNPNQIFTRKTMELDNRVWRLMLIVIFLSMGLLSYRLLDKEKCTSFSVKVKTLGLHANDVFYTGETLSFIASIPSKDISWNFGDHTGSLGATVYHQFLKEGTFIITAGSNALCTTEQEITIKNRPVVIKSLDSIVGNIAGPSSCYTFTEQIFTFTGSAKSYEWSIPNHQSLGNKSGQTIKYTFTYAGKYTVQVELDHDRNKRYFFDVTVEETIKKKTHDEDVGILVSPTPPPIGKQEDSATKPPPEPDTTPTTPPKPSGPLYLADPIFQEYLLDVIRGTKAVQDFEKYFCGGAGETPVIANGKREKRNFAWLCKELQDKKGIPGLKRKIKLKSAVLHRINGCVNLIEVSYR